MVVETSRDEIPSGVMPVDAKDTFLMAISGTADDDRGRFMLRIPASQVPDADGLVEGRARHDPGILRMGSQLIDYPLSVANERRLQGPFDDIEDSNKARIAGTQ